MSDWAGIAWLVVLLAFNAFFVGAEFAVISARRSQIEPLAERVEPDRALDLQAIRAQLQQVRHVFEPLLDLADRLGRDVLDGDDAGRAAVLVRDVLEGEASVCNECGGSLPG